MGTKNDPGAYDCYANAEPDEPLFVLLARDKHAPTLVWLWATLREFDDEDPAKVAEARQCALAMITWASAHDRASVGLGQATLAGVMELIREINALARRNGPKNDATTVEQMRHFLAVTEFEKDRPE